MTSLRTSQFGWEPHVVPVAFNRFVMLTGYADPAGGWRFTCETARVASVDALGHGRLPGSYEELAAAR